MSDDVRPAPLVRRWPSPGPWLDGLVVAGLFVADLTAMALATAGFDVPSSELGAVSIILAAASAGALWWRRRRPLLVFAVTVALITVTGAALDEGLLTHRSGAVVVLSVYAIGSWSEHRRWALAVTAVALALAVAGALGEGAGVVESLTAGLAAIALPWVLGLAARTQRRYIAEVERRLDAAVRERDEQARRAVADERAHIARELHDVVAHHVSLIGVQAGAARTALDRSPQTTRTALGDIEAASRDALSEMRRLLDTLRDSSPAALTPHPGLDDVGRLAAGFDGAGVEVILRRTGTADRLPPVFELCCFRIVEEALTNVTRHSEASRAMADIERAATGVRLVVVDPGPSRPGSNGGGRGLLGMSERVGLFGGTLAAGPLPGGGFAVVAELPLDETVSR
jgi:signal transduction histidine kinase